MQARRETYVGQWLPEPLLTSPDVAADVERADTLSWGLLVVLETLSPLERAVFVLREAFAFPYSEIAVALDRSEASVRQVARRARTHVQERQPRFDTDDDTRRRATEQFLTACENADFEALMAQLAPDVTMVNDTGGKQPAPDLPVEGAKKVAQLLLLGGKIVPAVAYRMAELNGGPAVVVTSDGVPVAALLPQLRDGLVQSLYVVANPDKLAGLTG